MDTTTILDRIGHTPIVPVRRLNPHAGVIILAKLESFNPAGSVKERVALSMVEAGEVSGALTPDKIVLEATSGNTGIGLAMVCAVKGYRCQLVMPESASIERRKILAALGSEILLTPAKLATDGAIEQAYAMAREHPERYFLTDQFNNPANWQAHYRTTGPEIWEQTNGTVTDVVVTLGTTGTAMGLCRYFADHHPQVRVTAMEPFLGHKIQGLKNMKESYKPGIFDKSLPHAIVHVADDVAFDMARQLARQEGLFVGMSSGAALAAALQVAAKLTSGVIVAIFPDGGEKYLSTALFSPAGPAPEPATPKLRFFNTAKRRKEVFQPRTGNQVTFYACGPTAHKLATLAHCRRFVVADLIQRMLTQQGYEVKFYMNFTDLDDNTIEGAAQSGQPLATFTSHYIEEFKRDMAAMGVMAPAGYPLASDYVEKMFEIAGQLLDRGFAYEKHGSVYFDIAKLPKYGKLSGVDLEAIQVGKTVDLDAYEKQNPHDFTLLKRSTLSELKTGVFFQTRWGKVRPGWHIECAAMTLSLFGDTKDIHTASHDLLFPHHENENAIAMALTGKPLARLWMHSGQLTVDGHKMSPELDNVLSLRDVLARGYTAREVRFFFLAANYRKPVDFTFKKLDAARQSLRRLDEFCHKLLCLSPDLPHPEVAAYFSDLEARFHAAMDDDLNVSQALGALFDFVKKVNPVVAAGQLDRDQKRYILAAFEKINRLLNVFNLRECPLDPTVCQLIKEREEARQKKDWRRADAVRAELDRQGIIIIDTTKGPVWKKKDTNLVWIEPCPTPQGEEGG